MNQFLTNVREKLLFKVVLKEPHPNYKASLSRPDNSDTAAKDLLKLEKGLEYGEMRSREIAAPIRCSAEYARR